MGKAKPFDIAKREVWEAFKRVRANQGAAGVDAQSIADRESTNYRFLSAKPIGSGSAVGKFVRIRDRM